MKTPVMAPATTLPISSLKLFSISFRILLGEEDNDRRRKIFSSSSRSVYTSADDGTVTPLAMPYTDYWDLNTIPNAGLTQVYRVTAMSNYRGRILYINKTQNTAGATVRLNLPAGNTFSTSGTADYDFTDAPACIVLAFSLNSIVMVMTGGASVKS